jgi:ABC-type amino acid transport system permease subunit
MVSKGMALRDQRHLPWLFDPDPGHPDDGSGHDLQIWLPSLGVNWNSIAQGVEVFDGWFYAGIIVITFNTAAYMAEIVNSGLNGIDKGQLEGAASLGLSPSKP